VILSNCPMTKTGAHKFTAGWRGRKDGETSCFLCHQTWERDSNDLLRSTYDFLSLGGPTRILGTATEDPR
jgi:hypothetical protein